MHIHGMKTCFNTLKYDIINTVFSLTFLPKKQSKLVHVKVIARQ